MSSADQCKLEYLQIHQIQLDKGNPRIAKWLETYEGDVTSEQIALALGAGSGESGQIGPSFRSLKQSIRTNNGIIHPIIVNRDSTGKYTVIEGNTRVQIYREFKERGIKGDWSTIPAMVHQELDDAEIDAIRLQAHLVGVRQWDPYSKAKYLNQLSDRHHLTLDQIVDYCGGDKRDVNTYIDAFNDMETYYRDVINSDQEFDPTRFSAFVELQSDRVMGAIVKAGYKKRDFAKWVHDHKIHPLSTVRKIPQILAEPRSKETFLTHGAQAAIKQLDPPPSHLNLGNASRMELAQALCNAIRRVTFEELQRLREEPFSEEVEALRDLCRTIDEFRDDIEHHD